VKPFLMHKDVDFNLKQALPWNEKDLTHDLELNMLFNAMALGDEFLFEVARKAVLSGMNNDLNTILYRQNILKDCFKNPAIVRNIYDITVESIERQKNTYFGFFSRNPASILVESIEMMRISVAMLKKLKNIADENTEKFVSEGFKSFFVMLKKELSDEYFTRVQNHLKELKFRNGVLLSAELGKGNKGTNYMLVKPRDNDKSWKKRVFGKKTPVYTFHIDDRDESGAKALSELKDRGINLVANSLAQSTEHLLSFFNLLRTELAFYIGCLNLHEQLNRIEEPLSFPLPVDSYERRHSFKGLYDVCLVLSMKKKVVGNDFDADSKDLIIITGANRGGKSTFMRSIGLSQLMMQCGMFVPAEYFSAGVCNALFTHFKREEDITMKSGKLDEEFRRMSDIVDKIKPNSVVLFNESFSATNEREGSEIARQIVSALLERRIKVFFVTHLYDFAYSFYEKKIENAIFLRAERLPDGKRTFKLIEGVPLETSYGRDLYNMIFMVNDSVPI
jgi:DNA mismatch repair ATPase MutS